jgi:hypothetical protein
LTHESVAHDPARIPPDLLLGRIEGEIHRLLEKRPALSDRIDRAANILVVHLSCPQHRPIRVRVRDGRPRFLVTGSGGAVYIVEPRLWTCSCPDYHRADLRACKHSLACYVLWRASRVPRKKSRCNGCGEVVPRAELREVQHEGRSEQRWPGDLLCKPCADRTGVEW